MMKGHKAKRSFWLVPLPIRAVIKKIKRAPNILADILYTVVFKWNWSIRIYMQFFEFIMRYEWFYW